MTILITGGAGYIGSHFALLLQDLSVPFWVLDNFATSRRHWLPQSWRVSEGCISDHDVLRDIFRSADVTSVVHFAGSTSVPESVANPLKYYSNNLKNSIGLFEFCVSHGVRDFLFSSTAAVYGEVGSQKVKENHSTNPKSPYGQSKLMVEQVLQDLSAATGISVGILRYFNVAGADPLCRLGQSTENATHLIKVACEAALGKRDGMDVFGTDYSTKDGTCVRDFIHVSDLVEAHLAVLNKLHRSGTVEVVNCGYGRGFTVLEVIDQVKRVSGIEFSARHLSRRDGDLIEVVADNGKLVNRFGWKPKFGDLTTIVRHALSWEVKLLGRSEPLS